MPSGHFPLLPWMGLGPDEVDARRSQVAQRVAVAWLAYILGAVQVACRWGEQTYFTEFGLWVVSLMHVAREVVAINFCPFLPWRGRVVASEFRTIEGRAGTFVDIHTPLTPHLDLPPHKHAHVYAYRPTRMHTYTHSSIRSHFGSSMFGFLGYAGAGA